MRVRSKLLLVSLTMFIAIFLMQFISQRLLFEKFYDIEKGTFLNNKIKAYEDVAGKDNKGEYFIKSALEEDCVIVLFDEKLKELEGSISLGGKMVIQQDDGKTKTFHGYGSFIKEGFGIGDRVKVETLLFSDGYTVITGMKGLYPKKDGDMIFSGYTSGEGGKHEVYEGVIRSIVVQDPRVERIKNALSMYLFGNEEIEIRNGKHKYTWEDKDYIINISDGRKGIIMGIVPLERSGEIVKIMNKFNLFIIAFALGLIYLVVVFFSKYLSDPLVKMRDKAGEIAQMNFEYDLKINRKDEFGELSESLETIAKNLDENVKELNKTNERLKVEYEGRLKMESQQKNLLMNISHDLKTPLTVVKGYLKGSKAGIYNKDEVIDKSIDAVDEITDTIKGMIELTRIKTVQNDQGKEVFPLDEVVFECLDEIEGIFKEKNQIVEINMVDDAFIMVDREEIKHVLMNILANASYHSGESSLVKIDLKEEVGYFKLKVFNSQARIPEADMEKIFEPFFQVEKSRTSSKGNGLGLSIVREILDLNGIEYSLSNLNDGVEFRMKIKGVASC